MDRRFFEVWQTLMKMLQSRGYTVPEDFQEHDVLVEQLRVDGDQSSFSTSLHTDADQPLLAVYASDTPINVPLIGSVVERLKKKGIQQALLVGKTPPTAQAHDAIANFCVAHSLRFEAFGQDELCSSFAGVEADASYSRLSEAERTSFLQRFGITEDEVPVLESTSVMARYHGLQTGDIAKLVKEGPFVTYRIIK